MKDGLVDRAEVLRIIQEARESGETDLRSIRALVEYLPTATPPTTPSAAAEEIADIYGLQRQTEALTAIIARNCFPATENQQIFSSDDVHDLCETLEMAAGDLDTEGLGDTDSCLFARKWAARLRGERQ